jgi:hypothetical protein
MGLGFFFIDWRMLIIFQLTTQKIKLKKTRYLTQKFDLFICLSLWKEVILMHSTSFPLRESNLGFYLGFHR